MKKFYASAILIITVGFLSPIILAQSIGIGTATPNDAAALHIEAGPTGKIFLMTGPITGNGSVPSLPAGPRMIFHPIKSAFRAGYVPQEQWNDYNIGNFSVAMGHTTIASGTGSIAMGIGPNATGYSSLAMGYNTVASGNYSTAMGAYVSTNLKEGSFVIGDFSSSNITTQVQYANQMVMRFGNGYTFYTSSALNSGVQLFSGGNSWSTLSDVKRKENFAPVNGDELLKKIAGFTLVSWNYIGQDSKIFRHYGPMAQEFYAAFGHDSYGTIGNDTTINQADFDGVNLMAIQALEKRTATLNTENQTLKNTIAELNARLEKIEKLMVK